MIENLKNTLGGVGFIMLIIASSVFYLNNIIWTFQNWSHLSFFEIILQSVSIVLFPPLGVLMGLIHFF